MGSLFTPYLKWKRKKKIIQPDISKQAFDKMIGIRKITLLALPIDPKHVEKFE